MGRLKTYDCKKLLISLGSHSVTGLSDSTFASIEASGDGVTKKVGCDGEVVRSLDPNGTAKVTLTLQYQSPTIAFVQQAYDKDRIDGSGTFPVLIKDMKGGLIFSAKDAWIVKPPNREFAKESGEYQIEIDCADVEWKGENTQ